MNAHTKLKLGSLFDGIGGFPYAGSFFGVEPVWASEILPQAVSVTMRHFPGMKHVGDITKLSGRTLPPVDIVTFGSPCQDLSTAGKRAGIGGRRSNLFYEAIRIIDEMRDATDGEYPKYAVWENVPGALSSGNPRGSDFRAVLEAFAKTEIPMPDSGSWATAGMVRSGETDIAWRILNACMWGVPQRRRRIFLVTSFGAGRSGEILFIEKGLRGNFKESCETGQGTASDAERSSGGTVRGCLTPWDVQSRRIHDGDGAWPALYGEQGGGHGYATLNCLNPWETQQSRIFAGDANSPTMAGADGGGGRNPAGLVFAAFCGGASAKARSIGYSEEISPTLKAESSGLTAPCLCEPKLARTLTARGDGSPNIDGGPNIVATEAKHCNEGDRSDTVAYGITSHKSNSMLSSNPHSGIYVADTSKTLDTSGVNPCANQGGIAVVSPCAVGVHQNQAGEVSVSENAYTLATTSNASSRNAPLVAHKNPDIPDASTAGLTSKGNGDCFLTPECHGALSHGGGQTGQGYPAVLVSNPEVHPDIAGTLCASGAGLSRPAGMASEPDLCVAYERPVYALQGNMLGRQDHNGPGGSGIKEDISFTITAADVAGVAAKLHETEPIPINDRATRYRGGGETRSGDGCGNGLGIGNPGDPSPTLSTSDKHAIAGIFNHQRNDSFKEQNIASTQSARQYKSATDLICENSAPDGVSAVDCRNYKETCELSGTIQAKGSNGYSLNCQNPIRSGYIVRRLTPTECERLQGFQDGWTAFGHDGKEISDTRRYQMLGNSVAIPCVAFVLGGIAAQMRK